MQLATHVNRTAVLLVALAGCGADGSSFLGTDKDVDVVSFKALTFALPKKSYALSSDDAGWRAPPPGGVFVYEMSNSIDLSKEVPGLGAEKTQNLPNVFLQRLDIRINNQLNVASPSFDLYVAPADVGTAMNAKAKKLATIASKAPGFDGEELITPSVEAKEAFADFARDFRTPFNLLAVITMASSGTNTAQGKVIFAVTGRVEAQF